MCIRQKLLASAYALRQIALDSALKLIGWGIDKVDDLLNGDR